MIKNYFKIAWRNILKQRLFSFINIGGLSISMAAVIIIFVWVKNELSFDNYHKNADKIYLLKNTWEVDKSATWIEENSFSLLAGTIEQTIPDAAVVTQMEKNGFESSILKVNHNLFKLEKAITVDHNWFKVFNYSFKQGSASSFYSDSKNIALTESKAKNLFGNETAIGKQVEIDSKSYIVAAVLKDNPVNSSFQFDIISQYNPIDTSENDWLYLRRKTFVQLNTGVNVPGVERKINNIIKSNSKAQGNITVSLLPLTDLRFANYFEYSSFKHINGKSILIFSMLAILLLLTAAINYVNLSIARNTSRIKEMSIRKISGAVKKQLFFQVMTESALTGFIALLLSIVLVTFCWPLLKKLSGIDFIFNPLNPAILTILIGTVVSIIMLTGIYPATILSSLKPVSLFNGGLVFGFKASSFKRSLVSVQFGLAVFLIIAAIVVYQQLTFIQKQDVAYNREQVFSVTIPSSIFFMGERRESALTVLKQELLSLHPVKNAIRADISSIVNHDYTTSNGIDWDGKAENFNPEYISYSTDEDIINIMGFKMAVGRWFDEKNIADKKNTVLNETAVKKFGLREPVVGKRFNEGIIIGVVKDFHHQSMHKETGALVIRTGLPRTSNFIIQAKPGQVQKAIETAGSLWKERFPGELFSYSFASDEFAKMYKDDQNVLTFTLIFSGLSILMCCMGLFGMTVFMTEQRRKEIGIRKVIGATVTSLITLLLKDFLKLVLIAFVIASPVAWWCMNNWLHDYAYRINISGWVFFAAGSIAFTLAIISMSVQTIKSATANPVKSLRTE